MAESRRFSLLAHYNALPSTFMDQKHGDEHLKGDSTPVLRSGRQLMPPHGQVHPARLRLARVSAAPVDGSAPSGLRLPLKTVKRDWFQYTPRC